MICWGATTTPAAKARAIETTTGKCGWPTGGGYHRRRPWLIAAVERGFPASLRQRSLAHKMGNLAAKLPEDYPRGVCASPAGCLSGPFSGNGPGAARGR